MSNDEWTDVPTESHDEWTDVPSQEPGKIEASPSFHIGSIPSAVGEALNPTNPWYKRNEFQGLGIDISNPEQQSQLETQKAIDKVTGEVTALPGMAVTLAAEPIVATSKAGSGVVAGLTSRLDNVSQQIDQGTYNPLDLAKAFASPDMFKDLRKDFPVDSPSALLSRIMMEVAPPKDMVDVVDETSKADMTALMKGLDPVIGIEGQNAIRDFGLRVGSDPLSYLTILPRLAPEVMIGAEGVEAGRMAKGGFAEQAAVNQRGALGIQFPFAKDPMYVYKGAKTLEAIDEVNSFLQARVGTSWGIRNLSQESGLGDFDAMLTQHNMQKGIDTYKVKQIADEARALGGYEENTSRLASMIEEHGVEPGSILAKQAGLKVNDIEIQKAQNVLERATQLNSDSNKALAEANGIDFSKTEFNPPTPSQQKEIKDYFKAKTGMDVPRVLVQDQNVGYDLTFSGYNGYDLGRKLKDEVAEAKSISENLGEFRSGTQSSGLSASVSSGKQRTRLSTEAMNAVYRQLGISEEAFDPTKFNVVANNALEKYNAARNLKFIDNVSDVYGVAPGQEVEVIQKAARNVEQARAQGLVPRYEDQVISKMSPSDFVQPSGKAFETLKPFVSPDSPVILKSQGLKFPKPIAARLDSMMVSRPPQIMPLRGLEWLQNQLSKNMLTSPFRVTKQYLDNVSRLNQFGALPDFLRELNPLKKSDWIDELANKIPSINETAWDLKDFKGPMKINYKIVTDPEVNAGYHQYLDTLHEFAEKNKLGTALGSTTNAVKNVVEFPNNNMVSNFIRYVGNSGDNLARKAMFRNLINDGYHVEDAVNLVNQRLMNFQDTTNLVKNMRYVIPFSSFQIKNLETIPRLIAARPGAVRNLMPNYDGYFYRALSDANGWSSDDYKLMNKLLPFNRNTVLGPVLRGQKEIINNAGAIQQWTNDWANAGLTDGQKSKVPGMVMSYTVPTFVGSVFDFGDLQNVLTSPFAKSAQYMAGINPYTGAPIEGTDLRDKLGQVLSTVNPYQFPKIYNKLVLPLFDKISPKINDALRQGPLGNDMEKIFRLEFGDAPMDRIKLDNDTLRELTSMKFLGLAKADVVDSTYYYHQMGLIKSMNNIVSERGPPGSILEAAKKTGKRQEVLRMIGRLQNVADDIKFNTKVYNDFRARNAIVQRQLSPDETKVLNGMKTEIDENATGEEAVPSDTSVPPEDNWQTDREPQSVAEPISQVKVNTDGTVDLGPDATGVDKMYAESIQHAMSKQGLKELTPTMQKNFEQFIHKELNTNPNRYQKPNAPQRRIASQ